MKDTGRHAQATRLDHRPPPDLLHHYTSAAGLLGIVGSRRVWATDLAYLNDSTELEYGLTELLRALEIIAQTDRGGGSFVDGMAIAYGFRHWRPLKKLPQAEIRKLPPSTFGDRARDVITSFQASATMGVTCFCEDGDLLSQWRGYGVAGYSLGFDSKELAKRVQDRYLRLCPVVYGRPTGQHLWTNLPSVDQLLLGDQNDPSAVEQRLTLPLLGLAAQVKDNAFRSEKEWRLGHVVTEDDADLGYRVGALGVTPYIDLRLGGSDDLLPLEVVHVAPGPDSELRATAVRSLLRHAGYRMVGRGAVEVRSSSIPFRG